MNIEQAQLKLRRSLESKGVTDVRVLDAIQATRRDLFVPEEYRRHAYRDEALPIDAGQTISQPFIVAIMSQAADLTGVETVLEIGTGSGYQTAILAQLCRHVVTIERHADLADPAKELLDELGYDNIRYRTGDGTLGCPDFAPYDAVLVTAAAPDVPAPLFRQLRDGGRLIVPVGDEKSQQLQRIIKRSPTPLVTKLCDCRFVKLIGNAGWPEE